MSHIVTIKTEVRDAAAVRAACRRLGLAEPTHGTVNEVCLGEHCPGLLRIPPGVHHGWMCIGQTEAYILNVVSEMYNYNEPDEYRTDPHENHIPYEKKKKNG